MASNIFTGASRYSTDFQSVIDRSVNIASLPLLQMQQNKVKISDESAALKSLDGKLASLDTTLTNLANSFGSALTPFRTRIHRRSRPASQMAWRREPIPSRCWTSDPMQRLRVNRT